MAPIRIGFLGLSHTSWARHFHLPYIKSSSDYEIVAICNSYIESSQNAIKLFSLPETKAYGDPGELAKDPNVDLVVRSTRVDKYLAIAGPSLKAGKDIVDWLLGTSLSDAREFPHLKNEGGVKQAIVSLRSR
ncbi:hypothetical protein BDZ45DRAFT_736756 [Acephala macrosclerotiorum]|nr:hypothetical protein BDZ45DRAFT_736756 [Acephala macrosclerotiorum]